MGVWAQDSPLMSGFIWITVIAIIVTGLAGGYYPLFKRTTTHAFQGLPLGESFAAGIFLSVGLIHMLPNAAKLFEATIPQVKYPLASLIAVLTFLLLLMIEHLAMSLSHQHVDNHETTTSIIYLMTIMLAVHSFLMGVALGVETSFAAALVIFIAILAHKASASFALSVNLSKSNLSNAFAISLFTLFLIMTPLGIIVGASIHQTLSGNTSDLVQAVFFSLASGTFLYMSTLHGLKNNPMIEHCCNMKEFTAMLMGFAIMAAVRFFV